RLTGGNRENRDSILSSLLSSLFPPFPPVQIPLLCDRQETTRWPVPASHAGKVYRRRFGSTRLAAALLAGGAPCFAIRACSALVTKRDCSYSSIHFSIEIAEISLPIASSGKSSGDLKFTQHLPMSSFFPAALNAAFSCSS